MYRVTSKLTGSYDIEGIFPSLEAALAAVEFAFSHSTDVIVIERIG